MNFVRQARPYSVGIATLIACAPRTPTPAPAPAPLDTVWYVSTRARQDGRDTRTLGDTLEYGLAIFHRDGDVATLGDTVRLDSADFARSLGDPAAAQVPVVLYVHGYGTSLREAWDHTAAAGAIAGERLRWVAFAWPSNGSGIAWPRWGAILDAAYHDDSTNAAASRPAFSRAARTVVRSAGAERTVVAAHSLGSQIVGEVLAHDDSLRATLSASPLRAVAFIAPDVELRRFADTLTPAIRPLANRVVLYASKRDRPLAAVRILSGRERAGLVRDSALVRPWLESVDVTNARSDEDWFLRRFGTHHALRRARGVLFDFEHLVARARPASCRASLGTGRLDARGVWRLSDAALPSHDVGEC